MNSEYSMNQRSALRHMIRHEARCTRRKRHASHQRARTKRRSKARPAEHRCRRSGHSGCTLWRSKKRTSELGIEFAQLRTPAIGLRHCRHKLIARAISQRDRMTSNCPSRVARATVEHEIAVASARRLGGLIDAEDGHDPSVIGDDVAVPRRRRAAAGPERQQPWTMRRNIDASWRTDGRVQDGIAHRFLRLPDAKGSHEGACASSASRSTRESGERKSVA